jgi:tetratricopeptide (TPR) repeat protein
MKRNFGASKEVLIPNKKYLYFSFIVLLFFTRNIAVGQKATITEEVKTIKTYPFSDPNPIPSFAINAKVSPYYPYFVFDGSTDKGINKEWKVVTLENEFISVTVLPEAGGKVWGAIEKSTGKEFIYQNHVMKFRSIGIRGPWTSGGIEHNFGLDLGHAPWTASPVDYILKENADGSVSCIVGGIDLASRTQWRVKINLPKDKACFETESMWYNPTPLHDAYLSWEVAAYKASNDLEFYFPGNVHIGHDGLVSQWPVDKEGHKLSVYKENNFGTSKSYHVFGMYPNWFGGYFHDSGFGSAHWSSYDDSPGKKLWIWSLARDGAIWEDLLTDSDGQYIEAQPGAYFNQPAAECGYNSPFNQLSMRPYYTETKSDFWFPVKGTEGMVDANPNGTLNLIPLNDSLKISFCPNVTIQDSLIVSFGKQVLLKEFISLKPLQVYYITIPFSESNTLPITVNIGRNLLNYTSDIKENEILRPVKTPAGQDFNSAEHLFRMAEDILSMRNYSEALKMYLACLEKEPTHSRALTKVAELYYRKGQFDEGLKYARKVLEDNTYDGGANFIYGIIQKAIGNYTQAEEAFSVAVRTMEFRSAAYVEIASLQLRKQNFDKAVVYAKKALDYNRFNISAYQFLASAYRKLNLKTEALETTNALLEIDPLNHYARFEQYLLNPSTANLDNFKFNIRNEFPYETYLELALEYVNQQQNDEAVQVLEQSPSYPTVYYWLAYLYRNSLPEKSAQFLKQAEAISPFLVFPYRLETIPVLQWARTKSPSWKTDYYLGLIFWNIQQTEKAKELFSKCGETPDYAIFYITRGILFQEDKSKYADVENDFKQAQKLDPKEWRTWFYLSKFYENTGNFSKQLETTKQMYLLFPDNPVVGITHAKALLSTGNYQECLKVLAKVNILPQEGAQEGHDIYELANLSIAVELLERNKYKEALKYVNDSKNWPENLGAGKPYDPDIRFQDYISAFCHTRLGDSKQAENYFQQIISYSEKNWGNSLYPDNIYIANQTFNKQGMQKDAAFFMERWKTEQDSLRDWKISAGSSAPKVQWVVAKYMGDEEKSGKLEKEIADNPSETRFRLFLKTLSIINQKNKY